MSIVLNDPIVKQDIIDRFNTRVRDWVTSNTNWVASTAVWNTTVGAVTAHSTGAGDGPGGSSGAGAYNRTTQTTTAPASPVEGDFSAAIGAQPLTVGHVVNVIRNFMTLYANNHRIQLVNNGNIGVASYTGVARLNDVISATKTAVQGDILNAAANRTVESGELVIASNLLNFIEDCRNIWTNRCNSAVVETFKYNYCHSSCHSNHGSHGSRGRR
jgi:hypothetical protein